MKIYLLLLFLLLSACTGQAEVLPTSTPEPTPFPPCNEAGKEVNDRVSERGISFWIYLPPCYKRDVNAEYPLLIWTAGPRQIADVADEMVMAGEIRPFLIVSPYAGGGAGFEQKITEELLPYLQDNYRVSSTRDDVSIAGVSHGAGIASRAAWRYPDRYGRLGVISGGIDGSEDEKFAQWITAVLPENYPRILVDIGEDDAIIPLTTYLTEQLDTYNVPYTFTTAPGGHSAGYWSQHMEEYIQFLVGEDSN